jgi:hypothetical protein
LRAAVASVYAHNPQLGLHRVVQQLRNSGLDVHHKDVRPHLAQLKQSGTFVPEWVGRHKNSLIKTAHGVDVLKPKICPGVFRGDVQSRCASSSDDEDDEEQDEDMRSARRERKERKERRERVKKRPKDDKGLPIPMYRATIDDEQYGEVDLESAGRLFKACIAQIGHDWPSLAECQKLDSLQALKRGLCECLEALTTCAPRAGSAAQWSSVGDTEQQDEFNLRMSMIKSVLWSLLGGDNWLEMAAFFCGHGIKVFSGGATPGRIDGMVERKAHTLATTVKTRVAQAAVIMAKMFAGNIDPAKVELRHNEEGDDGFAHAVTYGMSAMVQHVYGLVGNIKEVVTKTNFERWSEQMLGVVQEMRQHEGMSAKIYAKLYAKVQKLQAKQIFGGNVLPPPATVEDTGTPQDLRHTFVPPCAEFPGAGVEVPVSTVLKTIFTDRVQDLVENNEAIRAAPALLLRGPALNSMEQVCDLLDRNKVTNFVAKDIERVAVAKPTETTCTGSGFYVYFNTQDDADAALDVFRPQSYASVLCPH